MKSLVLRIAICVTALAAIIYAAYFISDKYGASSTVPQNQDIYIRSTKYSTTGNDAEFDMGEVFQRTSLEVTCKNNFTKTIVIDDLKTSCGCTISRRDRNIIDPGETTVFAFEINPISIPPDIHRVIVTLAFHHKGDESGSVKTFYIFFDNRPNHYCNPEHYEGTLYESQIKPFSLIYFSKDKLNADGFQFLNSHKAISFSEGKEPVFQDGRWKYEFILNVDSGSLAYGLNNAEVTIKHAAVPNREAHVISRFYKYSKISVSPDKVTLDATIGSTKKVSVRNVVDPSLEVSGIEYNASLVEVKRTYLSESMHIYEITAIRSSSIPPNTDITFRVSGQKYKVTCVFEKELSR